MNIPKKAIQQNLWPLTKQNCHMVAIDESLPKLRTLLDSTYKFDLKQPQTPIKRMQNKWQHYLMSVFYMSSKDTERLPMSRISFQKFISRFTIYIGYRDSFQNSDTVRKIKLNRRAFLCCFRWISKYYLTVQAWILFVQTIFPITLDSLYFISKFRK